MGQLKALLETNSLFAHPHQALQCVSLLALLLLTSFGVFANDRKQLVKNLFLDLKLEVRLILSEFLEHE